MTPEEGENLLKKFYRSLLPHLGVNRNIPRVFLHATVRHQGLGLPDSHLEQTIAQLAYFTMHISINTLLGDNMRASTEQLQLEVGVGAQFLRLSYSKIAYLATECWLKCLWEGVARYKVKVECYNLPSPPL